MNDQRWFIILSPDGAARTSATCIAGAFSRHFGDRCKTFDSLTYRQTFSRMLVQHDEDFIADMINQSLTVSCLDFQATHLLVPALAPVTRFTLNLLRKYHVVTIHWFFEDFRRASYWSEVLPGYDHFCAIQRGPIELYCKKQGVHYHFLPTACSTAAQASAPINTNPTHDVAFIGIPSAYRIAVLEGLVKAGFSLLIAGSGWKNYTGALDGFIVKREWVDGADAARILTQAKIGINLSVDIPIEVEHTQISPRVYDILLAGCLLVTEKVPLLADTLSSCTYHTFTSIDQAIITIRKLLNEYSSHAADREKNRAAIVTEHTYDHRAHMLMNMTG